MGDINVIVTQQKIVVVPTSQPVQVVIGSGGGGGTAKVPAFVDITASTTLTSAGATPIPAAQLNTRVVGPPPDLSSFPPTFINYPTAVRLDPTVPSGVIVTICQSNFAPCYVFPPTGFSIDEETPDGESIIGTLQTRNALCLSNGIGRFVSMGDGNFRTVEIRAASLSGAGDIVDDAMPYQFENFISSKLSIGLGTANLLTAHSGGGQGSASPLLANLNRIGVCASSGDSCLLQTPVTDGLILSPTLIFVQNDGAYSASIWAASGVPLNEVADTPFSLVAGQSAVFFCTWDEDLFGTITNLQWQSLSVGGASGSFTGTGTSALSLNAGQTVNVQVTVTGAVVGKPVRVGMTNWAIDMFATAYVSATNTVTINVLNMTGGAFAESVTFTATVDA